MERENEKFSRWVQAGGQLVPDTETKEGRIAWSRIHDLYEFCNWRVAPFIEASPSELLAVDGADERRWRPKGGLVIEDWPYLKACCCVPGDDDATQITRDEVMESILANHLQREGYSFVVACSAVDALASKLDASRIGPLREVVEKLLFKDLIAALVVEAGRIQKESAEYRRTHAGESKQHPNGPQIGKHRFFWWSGTPYHLSIIEFAIVSALWNAPEKSLPVREVLQKVWDIRPAAQNAHNIATLSERKMMAVAKLSGSGIKMLIKKDRMGEKRLSLILP